MRHPEQRRKISDQTVARRYRAGATLESLAIAAGSNAPVIRRILADQGVALRPKLAQLHILEQQIAAHYRDGSSLVKVAVLAGCSRDVIRRILRRDGVAIRASTELKILHGTKPRITAEAMQARYEAGSSLSQIAAVAGTNTAWNSTTATPLAPGRSKPTTSPPCKPAGRIRTSSQLPAIRWKLQNVAKLKQSNPGKFARQAEELRVGLEAVRRRDPAANGTSFR